MDRLGACAVLFVSASLHVQSRAAPARRGSGRSEASICDGRLDRASLLPVDHGEALLPSSPLDGPSSRKKEYDTVRQFQASKPQDLAR